MTIAIALLTVALAVVNGANDVSKGIATLAGAGVTGYRTAVAWGAVTTLVGGLAAIWLGEAMRTLFSSGIVDTEPSGRFALSVLVGTIGWVSVATGFRLPVSTTHALVGSLLGGGAARCARCGAMAVPDRNGGGAVGGQRGSRLPVVRAAEPAGVHAAGIGDAGRGGAAADRPYRPG